MDTTDPDITFDERGWCDYCRNYYDNILPNWHTDDRGAKELENIVKDIKKNGKGRSHDCLIGISGGVDSSSVAYMAKDKLGLNPLLFHVDAGWNSQESVNNIQRLVEGLGLDLYTEVIDWSEMKDLQLAFFKAQLANIDIPQDLAFFSALYNFAVKNGFKYVLTGANYSTECVREPHEWGAYYPTDMRFVKDVHRRFGQRPLLTFPTADIFKYKIFYSYINGIRVVKPLNYVPYIKETAINELSERFGWQRYAQKHHESRFTRFVECYWLPRKFGYERRKAHLSSLILTNQMTRKEALERIKTPELDEQTMIQDFEYVAKKLDLTLSEFQDIFNGENKTYRDYKNNKFLIELGAKLMRMLGFEKRVIR
jgi:N-acetyl sugar amidotransferase